MFVPGKSDTSHGVELGEGRNPAGIRDGRAPGRSKKQRNNGDLRVPHTALCCVIRPHFLPQDEAPMLSLRASILDGTDLALNADAASIMATWGPLTRACSASDCVACLLSDARCGVAVSRGGTTCNWMYIACSGGAVSSVSLSE